MNDKTLQFYDQNAKDYAQGAPSGYTLDARDKFISALPVSAHILELGCGGGHDAQAFIDAGFDVTLLDGSSELARIAQERTGKNVIVKDFQDIGFSQQFDAVWAHASLLHVPSDRLNHVFENIERSLVPGGVFMSSFKVNDQDWTDKFGRYYCAMDKLKFVKLLSDTGFSSNNIVEVDGGGYDGNATRWLWVMAHKN